MKGSLKFPFNNIWFFLFLVFLFRLAYIYLAPLQLVPDEAYYWDWSRHLDIGYYSKPPMVAWLNYISTHIFGINELGVRFFAVFLGTGSVGLVYILAKIIFNEQVAFWSAILSLITPANCALSLIMTIDPPLIFFGVLSLIFLWKTVSTTDERNRVLYFIFLGLAMGLGILSKQMMLVYFCLVPVFLLQDRDLRSLILSKGFFLFVIISILFLSLPMYWNFNHGWVTFQETAHHISSNPSLLKGVRTFLEYIGSQLFLMTPVFGTIIYLGLKMGILRFKQMDRPFRFFFIFGGIPLILFLIASLKQRINPNWPAIFYPPAIIFSIAWLFKYSLHGKKIYKWLDICVLTAYLFVCLTYMSPFIFSIGSISGTKIDPTKRAKGWKELAALVDKVYGPMKKREKGLFLLSERRDTISELAFYLPEHPFIYKWDCSKHRIKDQYEIWGGPGTDAIGKNSLIILKTKTNIGPLRPYFKDIVKLRDIKVSLGRYAFRHYSLYKGEGFRGW